MRYKAYGQRTILDEWLSVSNKQPKSGFLEQVDAYVDWGIFRKPLESAFEQSPWGPNRFDLRVLFRMVHLLKEQAKAVVRQMKARLEPLDTRAYCA